MYLILLHIAVYLLTCGVKALRRIDLVSLRSCMQDSAVDATRFSASLYPGNYTFDYDAVIRSSLSGFIFGEVTVHAYGIQVLKTRLDPCDYNFQMLCPISPGEFDIRAEVQIDKAMLKMIPNIAYSMPDLDSTVRLSVYNSSAAEEGILDRLACVETFLSNGVSFYHPAVGWIAALILGAGFFTCSFILINRGRCLTQLHMSAICHAVFTFYQSQAFVILNSARPTPPAVTHWGQNFVWTLGIIRSKLVQRLSSWFVEATYGSSDYLLEAARIPVLAQRKLKKRIFEDFTVAPVQGKNVFVYGIARVSYLAHIELSNLYMTILIVLGICLLVVVMLLTLRTWLGKIIKNIHGDHRQALSWVRESSRVSFTRTIYNLMCLWFPSLAIFSLWEFIEKDSVAVVFDAVCFVIILCTLYCYGIYSVWKCAKKSIIETGSTVNGLYGHALTLSRYSFFYKYYQSDCYYFCILTFLWISVRSIILAFFQDYPKPQSILYFINEVIIFGFILIKNPFITRPVNNIYKAIHLSSCINGLMFVFFSRIFTNPTRSLGIPGMILVIFNIIQSIIICGVLLYYCFLIWFTNNAVKSMAPLLDDRGALATAVRSCPNDSSMAAAPIVH